MAAEKQTKFIAIESDGQALVRQVAGLLDGREITWTRERITRKRVTFKGAQKAIAKLNAEKYGGFDDWRLATVEELFLRADRTKFNPASDAEFFPESDSEWSGTVDASSPSGCAWLVSFGHGLSNFCHQSLECFVRAVRSSQ